MSYYISNSVPITASIPLSLMIRLSSSIDTPISQNLFCYSRLHVSPLLDFSSDWQASRDFWTPTPYISVYLPNSLFLIKTRFSRIYLPLEAVVPSNSQKEFLVRGWSLVSFLFPSSLSLSNSFKNTSSL